MPGRIFIGTAGWSIPRASAHRFAEEGTHLQRYARVFAGAEINSSFHRPHAPATYAKWAASTPPAFRFAVKIPRTITHDRKLRRARSPFEAFLEEAAGLGKRKGPLLVQLPPSLAFEPRAARTFLQLMRARDNGPIVCEPRHESWFSAAADSLLAGHKVARVAADPPVTTGADVPGGWNGIVYYRLHGSPRKYWSKYDDAYISSLADAIRAVPARIDVWCVFDNTASGAALENAWDLDALVRRALT
jgi:uncharacterized protein YecE (DUF72 family)